MPVKKKLGFIKAGLEEFKSFAIRGNVIDLAVGVIIGAAFNKVVTSVVGDLVSPLIGLLIGNVDMSEQAVNFKDFMPWLADDILFKYGAFLTTLIDFLLTALSVFLLVKAISALRSKAKPPEEAPEAPPAPEPRKCPYCITEIPAEATRCPHCTSQLTASAATLEE